MCMPWAENPFWLLPFLDRKSTRLNSSHLVISYAVFCLKKKKKHKQKPPTHLLTVPIHTPHPLHKPLEPHPLRLDIGATPPPPHLRCLTPTPHTASTHTT